MILEHIRPLYLDLLPRSVPLSVGMATVKPLSTHSRWMAQAMDLLKVTGYYEGSIWV